MTVESLLRVSRTRLGLLDGEGLRGRHLADDRRIVAGSESNQMKTSPTEKDLKCGIWLMAVALLLEVSRIDSRLVRRRGIESTASG